MPVHLVDHPFVQDALWRLRDGTTGAAEFRRETTRITHVLIAEALRDLPIRPITVATPLGSADGHQIDADVVIVPVLRAGMGMLDAVLSLLPEARVGHIGLQRDEATAVAERYYAKLPPGLAGSRVVIIDPMLATGGSSLAALDLLAQAGAGDMRIVCIVAAAEGLQTVEQRYPNVAIFTPAIDRQLDARKFIVPGLGDFGDRLYATA